MTLREIKPVSPPAPNQTLIDVLEHYLTRARTGEIRSIAGVVVMRDKVEIVVTHCQETTLMIPSLIGGLSVVKHTFVNSLTDAICQN